MVAIGKLGEDGRYFHTDTTGFRVLDGVDYSGRQGPCLCLLRYNDGMRRRWWFDIFPVIVVDECARLEDLCTSGQSRTRSRAGGKLRSLRRETSCLYGCWRRARNCTRVAWLPPLFMGELTLVTPLAASRTIEVSTRGFALRLDGRARNIAWLGFPVH